VTSEQSALAQGRRVPEANRSVVAPRGQPSAVRAEGQTLDLPPVPRTSAAEECHQLLRLPGAALFTWDLPGIEVVECQEQERGLPLGAGGGCWSSTPQTANPSAERAATSPAERKDCRVIPWRRTSANEKPHRTGLDCTSPSRNSPSV
jgi:hypothetical protein